MGKSFTEDARGNALLGVKAREENKQIRNEMLLKAITGDYKPYAEKVAKLRNGIELTEPEKEYLDRMDKWIAYRFPKLASIDPETGKTASLQIILQDLNENTNPDSSDENVPK